MASGSGAAKKEAISAALRRFPRHELAIHRLMARSETFCDMCEELAEAEVALSKINQTVPALREARKAEWQELIDLLIKEVGAAIEDKDIVIKHSHIDHPHD